MNLLDLSGARFGGWTSFTGHLLLALESVGEPCTLLRVGKRTEARTRPWRSGMVYRNVSVDYALAAAADQPSLMTAVGKAHTEAAQALAKAHVPVVFHDPTETHVAALDTAKVVIRVANLKHVPEAEYLPHPYVRARMEHDDGHVRMYHAVATSRLDWDKHTDIIIEANNMHPESTARACFVFGAENRLYTHHKLPDGWRRWYGGQMPADDLWAGARLARHAKHVVDMSVIAGDGGGTQYTHLEAMDAGAHLVLHADWFKDVPDAPMRNCCRKARTPWELEAVLHTEGDWSLEDGACARLLALHTSVGLFDQWAALIRDMQR